MPKYYLGLPKSDRAEWRLTPLMFLLSTSIVSAQIVLTTVGIAIFLYMAQFWVK